MSDTQGAQDWLDNARKMFHDYGVPLPPTYGLVSELVAEVESQRAYSNTLAEQIDTMIEKGVEEGLRLKSLTVENGESNLSITTSGIAEHTVLTMLDGLADMLGDATNYVEFDLRRRGKTPVSVCVRRYQRPTPHELREKAEAKLDAIRELAENPVEMELGAEMVPVVDLLAILDRDKP